MKIFLVISLLFFTTFYTRAFSSSSFKGKVVLITGGSYGIGFSTAMGFAREGANVVLCARDAHPDWWNGTDAQNKIKADLEVQAANGTAIFIKADIRNIDEIHNMILFTHNKYGKIDIAVNNAGIGGFIAPLVEVPDDLFFGDNDAIYNNLYGVLFLLKEEMAYWMENGDKNKTYSIINLSSYNGVRNCAGAALYAASKHGIIGLTKSAALEHINTKPKIKVNAIAPGLTNTALTRNQAKAYISQQIWEGDNILDDNPLYIAMRKKMEPSLTGQRIADPEEMTSMIMALSDDSASYVTGTVLSVDNGDTEASNKAE